MYGCNPQEALPAALALEIFHNFTLLHDDVMDNAPTRRGRPTVHAKYGENTAILSGDQMLIEAYRRLEDLPTHQLPQILCWFNEMATGICEGQQYDMLFETAQTVTIDDYINMIRLKTSVLLANALRIGAYIAGAKDNDLKLLYDYGINIGLAFQLQDDLLDVYGDPQTFGKQTGGDILNDKKTFLYLTAQQIAPFSFKDKTGKEKIDAVKEHYDKTGVRIITENKIKDYTDQAIACLTQLSVSEEARKPLLDIAHKLLLRND